MGHTSLKYLQSGQFDLVKLDGALVGDIETSSNDEQIVESIMHLSHSMGFDVVAEYVENEGQKAMLEQLGCTHFQGYLYSAALSLDGYIDLLKVQ